MRRRENEHFGRTIEPEDIISLIRVHDLRPADEVFKLTARLLREKVVGDAQGHLAALMELLDDFVIFGIVLVSPSSVTYARHSQAAQAPPQTPGRGSLSFPPPLPPLRPRSLPTP